MFRRVEMIHPPSGKWFPSDWKDGLMSALSLNVIDAWIHHLRGSRRTLPPNARFYFTEKGWREIGRPVIAACQADGQRYRIIKVKETDASICWRDRHNGYEVALQPPRRNRRLE